MTVELTGDARQSRGIPRYRASGAPAFLSAGFRPFFLLAALWAAVGVPLWLALFGGDVDLPTGLPAVIWHAHEMIFGFGLAAVAGFLLTAIPNWTGRMPLQGMPLAGLVGLWTLGRLALLVSQSIGNGLAALADLAFPAVFLAVIAREIVSGRNWRNLPMLIALTLLLSANLLVHLEALGLAQTAELGIRLGLATLLMLISFVGGRIIPSFTYNWLAKNKPQTPLPSSFGRFDVIVLIATALALAFWVIYPDASLLPFMQGGVALLIVVRLVRWRGYATLREPLLWVLHLGYGWIAVGFILAATSGLDGGLPQSAALHAFSAGAVGTMILAVMTRASLGHTGRPLKAGRITTSIYLLVTVATVLRIVAPLAGDQYIGLLWSAGAAWLGAFGLFVFAYGNILLKPRAGRDALPI